MCAGPGEHARPMMEKVRGAVFSKVTFYIVHDICQLLEHSCVLVQVKVQGP